jgi:serine/threonine protein kinase/Tol biopolymer transport system component
MADLLRFGIFEADLRTGELRKNGVRIRLAPQAFQILATLAQRPGELVSRQELRRILWPNETVVAFEHSINTAVKRIRAVLNDSSGEPRYVETLSRRGYRFIAQVERISRSVPPTPSPALVALSPTSAPAIDWENPMGAIVSHYRILGVLGRGGMGIVYRAEDIHLGRQVALKFQPPALERDDVARERFRREARSASALNHPNICTVYEVDTGDGRTFIAMELLEGETLRDRISRAGPLDTSGLIELAIPVSDALEAAHEQAIVHRDIKPGNIFLTRRGEVKVLDFGLAKATARRRISTGGISGPEREPNQLTRDRSTPGTAMYMSPEQVSGDELDTRSDLYSFGVVLHEAATGRAPGIAFAVPDELTVEAPYLEPKLREIIARLLERDRALRYQTAGDVAGDLRRLRRDLGKTSTSGAISDPAAAAFAASARHPPGPPAGRIGRYALTAAALVAIVCAVVVLWARHQRPAWLPLRVVPFSGLAGTEDDLSFSPDGKQAAFSWNGGAGEDSHVYVKLIDAGPPLELTTEPGFDSSPAWSPDGRYIAFTHGNNAASVDVLVVPALGGPKRKIASIQPVGPDRGSRALTWTPDGTSLVVSDGSERKSPVLCVVSAGSGEKRPLTSPLPDVYGDGDPQFSPDGRTLAFLRWERNSVSAVYLLSWPTGQPRRFTTGQTRISGFAWTADGAGIVAASTRIGSLSTLLRIPLSGAAPSVVPGVGEDAAAPAIATRGNRLAYTYQLENTNMWRMPLPRAANGAKWEKLAPSPRQQISSVYSPDGARIAFSSDRSGSFEIWVCDSDGSHPLQLTSLGSLSGTPHWSPDGSQIVFDSRVGGHGAVFVVNAGGGEPRQLTHGQYDDIVPSWSRDGTRIYFASNRGDVNIWQMPASGGTPSQVTHNGGFEAEESADGAWLYFSRTSGGVWRQPRSGGSESRVLNRQSARYWTLAGQDLYFIDMLASPTPAVNVLDLPTGRVRLLATLDKVPDWGDSGLSVSPDGRWLIWSQVDELISRIMLVDNFR